ncbi:MAG: sodium/proline symporter [Berryella intestinalis]|uniref:sodium/proline symporter n=1 Tax=Berryella intestinalis TaxID=1531429 RepID=UPI002A762960|nr:sodium/proline symporter [Berryella intestinalis]MDY3129061.1 sodium/proline symporter [Berryella intestinalis]
MVENDFFVLLAMLLYFIVVLTIGFVYAKRSNSSASEYFIGGRGVGPWLTALSAEASDMSGWLLMGLPGVAYFTGASDALWTGLGLAIGTYLNWKFVAKRLRLYSERTDSITLPDFYSKRFGDRKNIISTVAAIIIVLFFSVYVGSCFVTVGKLFATLFGLDYATMMILGAIIVFLYTLVGGYLSVVVTDFVQGMLMFFALAVVVVGSIAWAGGIDNTVAFMQAIPGFLSGSQIAVPAFDETGRQLVADGSPVFGPPAEYGFVTMISMLAWGLGYFGMPQVLVRFMSIRDAEEVRKSRIIATTWVVISMASAVIIGLVSRVILPTYFGTQAEAENAFIVLAQMMLPSFICGVVVSGIFAASMSSSSSYLLIASSSVAENMFRGVFKRDANDRQVLIVARFTLIVVFLFGILVAYDENSSIFSVVSYAWAGLGASFGPLTLTCLYWRRTTMQGALSGMVAGAVSVLVWHNLVKPLGGVFGIYELLPAFVIALAVNVAVSLLTKPPTGEVQKQFDTYMESGKAE